MDVSPKQIVSIATALIPFLEHDDANRALMGANMQRQAVPVLRPEAPFIGTGVEAVCARDAGELVIAEDDGTISEVTGSSISVEYKNSPRPVTYRLSKFRRSNQGTCINQKPLVTAGDAVVKGDILADGPSTYNGELALGKNLLVAFMPWKGHNFEDAIVLSQRLVRDDVLTSIHVRSTRSTRDTAGRQGSPGTSRTSPRTS
jgi:DNA-directed RNA polymerase subunit beta